MAQKDAGAGAVCPPSQGHSLCGKEPIAVQSVSNHCGIGLEAQGGAAVQDFQGASPYCYKVGKPLHCFRIATDASLA